MTVPSISWQGFRSDATRELAIQIDSRWMRAVQGALPTEWWRPFYDPIPISPGKEAVALVVDMEDLGTFKRRVGPRTAGAPPRLTRQLIPREPWYRDRHIPLDDLKYNDYMGWPDKLAAILLAARRTPGMIFTESLFASSTTFKTIQGIPLIGTGHRCNYNDATVSATFDNLWTANFDTAGWEFARATKKARKGPDGKYGLDQEINYVLGGTAMEPKFARQFKRTIVLEAGTGTADTGVAGVTNIHYEGIEGGVIAVTSSWLDNHPWLLAHPDKDQWWTFSTTLAARCMGMLIENGGAPTVDIFDEGSEYARQHGSIWIKADMDANAGAGFPQVVDEFRGT